MILSVTQAALSNSCATRFDRTGPGGGATNLRFFKQ